MRIVIDLNKNADPEEILSTLYKRTQMHNTFGINILALVDGSPHRLTLKQALRVFAEHRLVVIRRRSEFLLRKNEDRLHILEALKIAIDHIDEVIRIIRKSTSVDEARNNLMTRFKLDEIQANAILEMPLRRLASLERQKIEDEYKEVSQTIKDLKALLKSPTLMRKVAIDELKAIKQKYGDARRTQIIQLGEGEKASDMFTMTDVMPVENFWIEASGEGLLSRTEGDKPNRLGGDGAPWSMIRTNTHQTVFLVTTEGKAAAIASFAVPLQKTDEVGVPASKVSPLHKDDILQGVFAVPINGNEEKERYVVTVTRQGMIKRSAVTDLPGASASTFTLVKVNENDELFEVLLTKGSQDIMLVTASGMAIRFSETEVRSMGLVAAGVNAIKLKAGDYVVGAGVVDEKDEIALLTQKGMAKRAGSSEYPQQGRYGQGVIAWKLDQGDQVCAVLVGKLTDRGICHFRKSASKVFTVTNAISRKRASNGQAVFALRSGDEMIGFTSLDDYVQFWEKA